MATWRDAVSKHAQDDLDDLISIALEFAQQELGRHGEFYPYAMVVDESGRQRLVAADSDAGQPEPKELVERLARTLHEQRHVLRAAAIVADVRVPELGVDAIRVDLEHAEGVSLRILLPYRRRKFRRAVDYGALSASAGSPRIW